MSRLAEKIGKSSLDLPRKLDSTMAETPKSPSGDPKPARPAHQRLVFSDPVALRYLEEDPATTLLERRRPLPGYEIFLVEQWACSRVHPTFIIATYTGDMSQSIMVGVLSVPTDESTWSTRLKIYFQAISQFHARKKETPLGTLMVTNLSGFPSALSVIPIPEGDIRKHREDFFVNENLKRLGCSGRAGLNLQPPPDSTRAKFLHLYRISDRVPFYTAVTDLVKLCQLALVIFDKLLPAYADGLLCDVTEKALNDWWSDIGTDMYNLEPNDGIMGPTTVAAIMGLVMGAHNRLKVAGAPVTKDSFEVNATKRAIASFQKAQKLPRTRRLDRQTLDKLHRVTAKAASGEGWGVPRAVKSTVAELSGKGGEMVMGIVGGKEKVGISEIETVDIERLSQLVTGARAKWLWQGKPIKSGGTDLSRSATNNDFVFSTDDAGGYMWTSRKRDSVWQSNRSRAGTTETADQVPGSPEQRSGLNRLKDAVGITGPRNHQHRHSRDLMSSDFETGSHQPLVRTETDDIFSSQVSRQDTATTMGGDDYLDEIVSPVNGDVDMTLGNSDDHRYSHSTSHTVDQSPNIVISQADGPQPNEMASQKGPPKLEKSPTFDAEKYGDVLPSYRTHEPQSRFLRRSRSAVRLYKVEADTPRAEKLPRHLSFSFIEDSVLLWDDVIPRGADIPDSTADPPQQIREYQCRARVAQKVSQSILYLEQATLPWTMNNVELVDDLEEISQRHNQELSHLYQERLDDFLTLRTSSNGIVNEERHMLDDGVKRVEVLGAKLDYELNALESRVDDVEDGVADFEKNIAAIENRIEELVVGGLSRPSWFSWFGWSSHSKQS